MRLERTYKFLRDPYKSAAKWRQDLSKSRDLAYTIIDCCANIVNRNIKLKGPLRASAIRYQRLINFAVDKLQRSEVQSFLKKNITFCRFIAKVIKDHVSQQRHHKK